MVNKGKSVSGALAILMVISTLSIMSFQVTPVSASPDELHVGPEEEYEQIQDAIDDANPGDVIIVYPREGAYDPFIVENKEDISIIAMGYVVVGDGVVQFEIQYDNNLENCWAIIAVIDSENINIEGIEVNGDELDGEHFDGIDYLNSSGSIFNCEVYDIEGTGIGIARFEEGSSVEISDVTIEDFMFGIFVWNDEATIVDCYIDGGFLGIVAIDGAMVTVENSDIYCCETGIVVGMPEEMEEGFSIVDERLVTAQIMGCQIECNGWGIYIDESDDATINFNDIVGNGWGVMRYGLPAVDARWNYWGSSEGPSHNPDGGGDWVSDNVLYSPWLRDSFKGHIWPDVTPSTIENALAIPDMISLITGTDGMSTGPERTYLTVEASDDDEIWSVTLNFRPLLEQMFANVEFEDEEAWQEFLEWVEDVEMDQWDDSIWYLETEMWNPASVLWMLMDEFDLLEDPDEISRILSEEIQLGDFTIPVTVTDWAGNESYAAIELAIVDIMVPLEEGWNLRSTPVTLANGRWGDIISLGLGDSLSYDVALRLDVETQEWEIVDEDYELRPLEAIYIHATERDQIGLVFSRELTAPPMRQLGEGWNLVGFAPPNCEVQWWPEWWDWSYLEWDEMHVREAMISIEETPEGHRGYTIVISPSEDLWYDEEYQYKGYEPFDWYNKYFEQESWVYTVKPWEYDVQWYEGHDKAQVNGYCYGNYYGYFEGLIYGYYYEGYYEGYLGGYEVEGSLEGYFYGAYYGYFKGYFEGYFYGWLGDDYYEGYYDDYYEGYVDGYEVDGYLRGYGEHWEYLYDCYMQPFCGYKVFMENPDLLAGFNETPLQWHLEYKCD